jgi:hypothetical protein
MAPRGLSAAALCVMALLTTRARAVEAGARVPSAIEAARVRLPPPCPDDSWVPDTLSQKCYKRFAEHVDFFACQAEVCGPRNATIVTPRTAEAGSFVRLKVVAPQVGADAESAPAWSPAWYRGSYWIGMYRQPEQRAAWAWVSYGLYEDIADTRPVPQTFFWDEGQPDDSAGWESCAMSFPSESGKHVDVPCHGNFSDGGRRQAKFPCVCQYPDVPHPRFELDMEQVRAHQPVKTFWDDHGPVFITIATYAATAHLIFSGLMLLLAVRAVAVSCASAERDGRSVVALLYEACLIFPLCLTTTIAAARPEATPAGPHVSVGFETTVNGEAARRVSALDHGPADPAGLCLREEASARPLPMYAAAADTEQPGWTRPRPHDSPGAGQLEQFGSGWVRRRRSVVPRDTAAGAASDSPGEQTTGRHGSLATSPWLHRAADLLFAMSFITWGTVIVFWGFKGDLNGIFGGWLAFSLAAVGFCAITFTLHAALFQMAVVHREHCMSILHELAGSGVLRRLERENWLGFTAGIGLGVTVLIVFPQLIQVTQYAREYLLFNLCFWVFVIGCLALVAFASGITEGLILGHAACITSMKNHLLRLLGSLEDEDPSLDSHAAESSSLKQLKSLAVVHAQLMKRTKSLLGPSVSVGLFTCCIFGYFLYVLPDPQDLLVRGVGLLFVVCATWFLRCLAKPGDEYKDMVLHLREFRLQSSAPMAKVAKHLLDYFEGASAAITQKTTKSPADPCSPCSLSCVGLTEDVGRCRRAGEP